MQMSFDHSVQYAEANGMATYGLFFHRANAKIDVSKETDRYRQYIIICDIILSGLHHT